MLQGKTPSKVLFLHPAFESKRLQSGIAIHVTAQDLDAALYAAEELELFMLLQGRRDRLLNAEQVVELNQVFVNKGADDAKSCC